MSKSAVSRNAVLNAQFHNAAYQITALYVSLHSGDPGTAGANELTAADGYARQSGATWTPNPVTAGTVSNSSTVTFGPAGVTDWAQATYFGLWDAPSGGNYVRGGLLTVPKTVQAGDSAAFAPGAMVSTET
jgi:hypothetical protein